MRRIILVAIALLAMVDAGSAVADAGLVGYWHLDEGSGTTTADSSGHGDNGNLSGDVAWVAGRFGNALSFGGTDGRVHVDNSAPLEPTAAVTVSAWVKHAGSPGDYKYIVAKGAARCIAASYALYSGPNGGLEFYVSNSRGTAYTRSPDAGTAVWDGNWHMVVGTYDGSRVRVYVDGKEVGSGTPHTGSIDYVLPDSNDLYIGDYPALGAPGCPLPSFLGTIDEVSVWNGALTAAQVAAAMPQASPDPTGGGGGGQPVTPPPPNGGGGPPAGGGHRATPPALKAVTVSPSAFAITFTGRRVHSNLRTGTTVSYVDTQAARSTFAVMLAQAGVVQRGRCVKPSGGSRGKHTRRCTRYVLLGSFTHSDRAGHNSFHFTGLPGRRLAPGRYRLDATPRAHGQTGRTVTVSFTIIH